MTSDNLLSLADGLAIVGRFYGQVVLTGFTLEVTMSKLRIKRSEFTCVRKVDECPDLSYLGEYSDQPADNAIDRGEGSRHYRYFNPTLSAEDTGNPDSEQQDYDRMEAYNRGDWCMIGVWAEARLVVGGVYQVIRSGGLWGIESDSDEAYIASVYDEQADELANILADMGVEVVDDRVTAGDDEQPERFDLCD